MSGCIVDNCDRKYLAKGLCGKHYQANTKYGHPLATARELKFSDRFWSKVDKSGDCWLWMASTSSNGYGQFSTRGQNESLEPAHRVAYRLTSGSIPTGKHLDHICHNIRCVNPGHLRPVTPKQNLENLAGAHRDSKTGVRGVSQLANGSYRASACSEGRRYYAGTFPTLAEAASAATALRNRLFTHNDADRMATK